MENRDDHRTSDPVATAARVVRLEESQAFLERQTDQLNAELIAVNKRLAELAARLARLEAGAAAPLVDAPAPALPPETLVQAERRILLDALSRAGGEHPRAAHMLGIDRAALELMLMRHGLT